SDGSLKPMGSDGVAKGETALELVTDLRRHGYRRIWLIGGATTAASLREADLITLCVISVIPVILGGGTPLFGQSASAGPARLVHTTTHPQGIVQNFYVLNRQR